MLAPGRRDAAVEVGPGATHVHLVLVGLGGDVVSQVAHGEQELRGGDMMDERLKGFWVHTVKSAVYM